MAGITIAEGNRAREIATSKSTAIAAKAADEVVNAIKIIEGDCPTNTIYTVVYETVRDILYETELQKALEEVVGS